MTAVLQLINIQKSYQTIRPLRMQELTIGAGERVALIGLDAGASEVMVNLVTGASLPDQGEVRVLGQPTAEITSGDDWLGSLDRFGIVSPRGVLLDALSVAQNIALVFTLQIDPVAPDTMARVTGLASACGIPDPAMVTGEVPPEIRTRVHLARAVALDPKLLILEHPTAGIAPGTREALAKDVVSVTDARRLTALVITQDEEFARMVGHRALRFEPATGALKPLRRGWLW